MAVALDDLARANSLFDYNQILAGQTLLIPAPVTPASVPQVAFSPSETPTPSVTLTLAPSAVSTSAVRALSSVPDLRCRQPRALRSGCRSLQRALRLRRPSRCE